MRTAITQSLQDPTLLLGAHQDIGFFSLWLGEWGAGREYFARALDFYDPHQHRSYVSLYEADLSVWALSEDAIALWCLGYPSQALHKSRDALTLAQEIDHPYTLGWTLGCAIWVHQYRWELQEIQERAEAMIALATEYGFPLWLGYGTLLHGWALAMQGHGETGIAQIQEGMAAWQTLGTRMGRTHFLALLAEAFGKTGQREEGLKVLAEALDVVDQKGERVYEAELHRLKGELLLLNDERRMMNDERQTQEAEACFHNALDVARHQQAKSLELRAATSLARLWQQQYKTTEARDLLTPVYHWFTEGFDTADLKDAKALLDLLAEDD